MLHGSDMVNSHCKFTVPKNKNEKRVQDTTHISYLYITNT
jgi:hypothetical protein